jgi:glycosyltransferase involved in cell wall biosynthesis
LLVACAILRRRPSRVVIVGHLVSPPWKRLLLAVATRLGTPGTLVVHSEVQLSASRRWLGRTWRTRLLPYQADTSYWKPAPLPATGARPLILAVGSEHRDYPTLLRAVDGLDVEVVIAAGSHWARSQSEAGAGDRYVTVYSEPLSFRELRDLYAEAACVVVPLKDMPNQSGVTVVLEAMSCGRPLIVTATRGQRECVTGPLVLADGGLERAPEPGRGPQVALHDAASVTGVTGLYVRPGDVAGLRRAIEVLTGAPAVAEQIGQRARESAVANFSLERFVGGLAEELERDLQR